MSPDSGFNQTKLVLRIFVYGKRRQFGLGKSFKTVNAAQHKNDFTILQPITIPDVFNLANQNSAYNHVQEGKEAFFLKIKGLELQYGSVHYPSFMVL